MREHYGWYNPTNREYRTFLNEAEAILALDVDKDKIIVVRAVVTRGNEPDNPFLCTINCVNVQGPVVSMYIDHEAQTGMLMEAFFHMIYELKMNRVKERS